MSKAIKKIRLDLAKTPFNLDYVLTCGQTFRWEKHGDWWHGVAKETFVKIRQEDELLQFRTYPENKRSFVLNYFRLEDDLPLIYSRIVKDDYVREAVKRFHGLRLLRQDPWECLISYICATNKNIPAIKKMIQNMCKRFGRRVSFQNEEFYTFPNPGNLAKASLRELRLCKLGFRAERVKETAKIINEGSFILEDLKKISYQDAKKQLMTLPGVGPKVADCVLLFSLDKMEAFPIDVWMKRIILEFYKDYFEKAFIEKLTAQGSVSSRQYEIIGSFARKHFGEYVGYTQEYLYHFRRCQQ